MYFLSIHDQTKLIYGLLAMIDANKSQLNKNLRVYLDSYSNVQIRSSNIILWGVYADWCKYFTSL